MVLRKITAFSLVELMVTLIIVSCIVAAMAPIITKKLKSSGVTVAAPELKMTCDKFGPSCSLCYPDKCVSCSKSCLENQALNIAKCNCDNCSDLHTANCLKCDLYNCIKCKEGYYPKKGKCEPCTVGDYCDGLTALPCPKGNYCKDGKLNQCPSLTYNNTESASDSSACKPCTANCSSCDKVTGLCSDCEQQYALNASGTCDFINPCGDKSVLVILSDKKICMTKYNIGDGGLPISPSVTVVPAGSDCNGPGGICCWVGQTSSVCNSNDSRYPGCNRTLCNWGAAQVMCDYLTYNNRKWETPSKELLSQLVEEKMDMLVSNGADSLLMCTHQDTGINSMCKMGMGLCPWSIDNNCIPHFTWSSTHAPSSDDQGMGYVLNSFYLNAGIDSRNRGAGSSVRCVSYI